MMDQQQVLPLLQEASPSFQAVYEEHRRDHGDDLLYLALGAFASHLLDLQRTNDTGDFPAVARAIDEDARRGNTTSSRSRNDRFTRSNPEYLVEQWRKSGTVCIILVSGVRKMVA